MVIIMITESRATSSTISFALALIILTLLSAILLSSATGITQSHQDKLDRKAATSLNNELTDSIQQVDLHDGGNRTIEPQLDNKKQYTITIKPTGSNRLYKVIVEVDNSQSINFVSTKNPIQGIPININGGDLKVSYNSSSDELVISNET